jgi:hypothetical protein
VACSVHTNRHVAFLPQLLLEVCFQWEAEDSHACTRCTPTLHTASPTRSHSTHAPHPPPPHRTASAPSSSGVGAATSLTQCTRWLLPCRPALHVTAPSSPGSWVCVGVAGRWRDGSSSVGNTWLRSALHARRVHVHDTLPVAHDGAGASAERSPRVVRVAGLAGWEHVGAIGMRDARGAV